MTSPVPLIPGVFGEGAERLGPTTRLECGVCWHVYDPAEGCAEWEVPPNTPFTALPDHWRCPVCDNEKAVFLPLDDAPLQAPDPLKERVAALEQAYRAAGERMRDTPFYNPALAVEAVGFHAWEDVWLGILITPWFMNIVLLPPDPQAWATLVPGAAKRPRALPAGRFDFEVAEIAGFGRLQSCSLFSPMDEFSDPAAARAVAEESLKVLLTPEEPPAPEAKPEPAPAPAPEPAVLDRRALLRGVFGGGGSDAP